MNVYVNNEDVRLGGGLDTAVGPGFDRDRAAGDGRRGDRAVSCLETRRSAALTAVGNTPLIELPRMSPNPDVRIFAKLEEQNPTGSIKDRVALSMVETAEMTGELEPGRRILEPTSGNTGIALAMIGTVKGYPVTAVMPESSTPERIELLRMYGAEIVFSTGPAGLERGRRDGALDGRARPVGLHAVPVRERGQPERALLRHGARDHRPGARRPGRRVRRGTRHRRDADGLLAAPARAQPDVQIVAAEPLQGDPVMGLRSLEDGYTPPILDITQLDRKVLVSNAEAVTALRNLLALEGVFAGVSAGAALAVARRVANDMDGGNIVCVFADGGSKYLSAGIYTKAADVLDREMEERVWW